MTMRTFLRTLFAMKTILMCVLVPVAFLPILNSIGGDAGRCAYGFFIIIVLWVFEVLPLPVTAMLPVVLFPMLGVLTTREACSQYIKNASVAVLAIFGIVAAVERWGLHKRIALGIPMVFGTKPHWLIFGMFVCTSVLSMVLLGGVPVLMLPIVRGIMDKLKTLEHDLDTELHGIQDDNNSGDEEPFKPSIPQTKSEIRGLFKALSLSVSYGCMLGATATINGNAANFVAVGLTEQFYAGYGLKSKLTFINWLVFAGPIAVILLVMVWLWFIIFFLGGKGVFRRSSNSAEIHRGQKLIKKHLKQEYKDLGPWSYPEIVVLFALLLMMILFLTQDFYFVPGWGSWFKDGYISSAVPACLVLSLLFIIPAKSPAELLSCDPKDRTFAAIITWSEVQNTVPWGIIVLIGGAFSLARACQRSGLTDVMGTYFENFTDLEPWLLTLVVTALTTCLTEFVSNTATITMLLPIVAKLAISANLDPLALIFPMTLAAKFSFMMPIATPPNALVYSLGVLKIKDMAAAGFVLNLVALVTLNIAAQTWGKAFFRWDLMPEEMKLNATTLAHLDSLTMNGTGT